MIEGSGLDEAWIEADLYSSVTINQIINGNHYSRALKAHEMTLQVLFDIWVEAFLVEHTDVIKSLDKVVTELIDACVAKKDVDSAHVSLLNTIESLELNKQLAEFDKSHASDPTFRWARTYMRQVMTLLQFQRATRNGDWELYLASLEKLCVYFFAYNRLDYAQNIPEYVARMYELETTDPAIWQQFHEQEFTVNTSNKIPFTRLGLDHAQEQLNKSLKGQGAINGITQTPATLVKLCLCAPELARIANETEDMLGISVNQKTEHHRLNRTTTLKQENDIKKLSDVLSSCNIFTPDAETPPALMKLITNELVPNDIAENILSMETRGADGMQKFVEERITGEGNLWDKMKKCKALPFNSSAKQITLQAKTDVLKLQAASGLMSRLLIVARSSRDIDMEEVIGTYEFTTSNRVLMTPDGNLHPTTNKSQIITVLENMPTQQAAVQDTPNERMCLVVDGMAVVHELTAVNTFETCSDLSSAYVALIEAKGHSFSEVRVVFDNYAIPGSLKDGTRERRNMRKGHISGKSKKACFDAFMKVDQDTLSSIASLGVGAETSDDTTNGCISFLCSLFCKKGVTITEPQCLRWTLFKQLSTEKGIDSLPPTYGAWKEHVRRAHCQASLWEQDLRLHPVVPDPLTLGWMKEGDRLIPVLSKLPPAPAAVVELVRCKCGATKSSVGLTCVSARCSCRVKDLVCTLCCCAADGDFCQNTGPHLDDDDTL